MRSTWRAHGTKLAGCTLLLWPGIAGAQRSIELPFDGAAAAVRLLSPTEGTKTTGDRIDVRGHIADGFSRATCNGAVAAVERGNVRCRVSLSAGVNTILLQAIDRHGDSASAAVRVVRQVGSDGLAVFPSSRTLVRGETRVFTVATDAGPHLKSDVTWSTSNPAILSIRPGGEGVEVTAGVDGRALLTAHAGGRAATASVIVVDPINLDEAAPGTTLWTVAPDAHLETRPSIPVSQSRDEGLSLFAVGVDPKGHFARVRALDNQGDELWTSIVPGTPLLAGATGGIIVAVGSTHNAIGLFDRVGGVPGWRFESAGTISDDLEQAPDGTLFLMETRREERFFTLLDGRTGLVKLRVPMPPSSFNVTGCGNSPRSSRPTGTVPGPLFTDDDGMLYVELFAFRDSWTPKCDQGRAVEGSGHLEIFHQLLLVQLTKLGEISARTLWRHDTDGPDTRERLDSIEDAAPGTVIVTGHGDTLAAWTHLRAKGGALSKELRVTRIVDDVPAEAAIPHDARAAAAPAMAVVDGYGSGIVYLKSGSTLSAINLPAWTTSWTTEISGDPFLALANRQVVLLDEKGRQLIDVGSRGAIVRTVPVRLSHPEVIIRGNGVLFGMDPDTKSVVEVATPLYVEAGWVASFTLEGPDAEARQRLAAFSLAGR